MGTIATITIRIIVVIVIIIVIVVIGSHEIGLQRNGARAALLALDQCYGLGLDNFLHYAERISSVTSEQVQEAAQQVIDFDRSALAVVGP